MASADERTPLLNDEANLRSDVSPPRFYQKQNRAFHLIVLIGLILVFVIAAFATVWFSFLSKPSDTVISQANESLRQLKNISWPRPDAEVVGVSFSPQILAVIEEAVDDGKEEFENKENIESKIKPIDFRSASYKHQRAIVYSPDSYNVSKYGYIENHATKYLRNKGYTYVIDYKSATNFKWSSESKCNLLNDNLKCNISKYRSIDGSCNNLDHPRTWGVAMTPFRRSLPANYNDGVSEPRGGFVSSLPSARDISTHVHRAVHKEDINFSVMLAVWGQFIDHDITATALSRGANGNTISCCNTKFKHPECFPVLLNKDDEYYSKFNLSCMEFVRSAPALRCSFGPREQLNQASSYFDGSMIYGNTENLSKRLRTYEGGRLEMSYTKDGRSLLPFSKDPIDGCNHIEEIKKGRYCFLSGDARANENSHLTSIHLIFARQHNEIVKQLSLINPRWDDEILYQEARRIVAAQVQHITYNEFLPIVVGSDLMNTLKLYSQTSGFWTDYNSTIDVTISNNFAASAFRFAHTLIPRLMKVLSNDTVSPEYVEMHQMLFNPFRLYEGDLDAIIRGAMNTDIERADNYFTDQLTNHLFESHEKTNKSTNVGLDLVSLNIQRGRDHGLPSYPYWREYCGFSRVTTFEELITIFDEDSFKTVTKIYKSVEEIDLYTGSLSEIPIEGGLVGPTITCLIADQFYRLKYGDRFWYETNEEPQAFTEEQLNEIRKTSLAGIICQNADDLKLITPQVMRSASDKNQHTLCLNIPNPDLTKFKDPTFTADDVLPQKIVDLEIKSNNFNSSWKGGLNISNNYIDDLIKHGISWKGVVTSNYPETRIKGNFSLPFDKNKTEGQFDVKFHNLDGELIIPSDIEIWSPVYVENKTNTSFSENDHFLPLILHGNRTANGFQWNGNFNALIKENQQKEINEEKVEYLPESNSDFEKSKRGEADSQSDYVDKQMLDDLIKKVRNENGNDSSAIRYLDSILIPSGDVSQHKIEDLEIKSNNFNSSWKGGLNISNNYIDDLIKHGISWKGVVSSNYPETRIKGNFSLPFDKNKTEGQFDVKFHNLDGELIIPSDIEIWSPVYVENKTNTSFSENDHFIPLILHGNRTADGFQWNGNFNALIKANQQKEINEEKVEYLPESNSDFEKSKRGEADSQSDYVDKQMLDDLIKKVRNENGNDSSAIRYLDSILIPSGDVSQHKIEDLEIKSNNFNSSWKGGLNISNNYIDDLIKHGISWKGVVTSNYPETRIKGNFSLPFDKNKTEGQFDVKFHNLDGELIIPSDIEIWSPVYVENKTNTSFSENDHFLPLILHGNRTADGFQWNGNFDALVKTNQQNEFNTEKVEYLPEYNSDFGESKRGEAEDQSDSVDKQMLDDLIKKIRNENANDSSAIKYLDSVLKHDDLNVTEKSDESEEPKSKAILTEIFKSKSLTFPLSSEGNATINNITFVSKNILEHIRNYTSKDNLTDIIFKWKWEPEGKLLRWEVLGNSTSNFTIKYEEMKGCCLKTNCTYYSKFAFKPDFNLTADVEPNACTVIAPIVVDEDTWPLIHNITVAIRKLDPNLEKEEEMSLKSIRERKQTFDHFKGVVSMSVDNELVTLWNGTLPAQFGTKWSWMRNNNTAAYPVAWSGIKINAFVGNFMFPEKINNSIVWHDGQFSFIIDDNVTIPDSIEVYYSILYLTTLDDIVPSNLSDVEEYTDWELNRFSRIILKGEFINDIFYWYGKITFIITDYNDYSNPKAVSYRPSIRYTGHIVGGMLYAKFNNKTDLWWSGILPSTVLVPVNISRGCKQVFDQVIVWNLTSTNDSFGHISFFTYSNDSRISLLGELDARLTSVLISSPLKINVTYYSPILLQEQKFDLTDDLSEMYRENSYGIFAPIILIGKYSRENAMFAWNGKFIISSFEN